MRRAEDHLLATCDRASTVHRPRSTVDCRPWTVD
jgi:hypothetical protein